MQTTQPSNKSYLMTLMLLIFLGYIGAHRFYVGKYISGFIWLLTGGLFSLGYIYDLILIITFNFRDDQNKVIVT